LEGVSLIGKNIQFTLRPDRFQPLEIAQLQRFMVYLAHRVHIAVETIDEFDPVWFAVPEIGLHHIGTALAYAMNLL
jgi:hypothetical protein